MKINDQELAILRQLQQDTTLSLTELSRSVGMSQSTAWRRLSDLNASGVIVERVARLDPAQLDCKLMVLASVSLADHSDESVGSFARMVRSKPEILECHAVSGEADYLLKIRTADVESYEAFMSRVLLRSPLVRAVTSSFVLRSIKETTALPI